MALDITDETEHQKSGASSSSIDSIFSSCPRKKRSAKGEKPMSLDHLKDLEQSLSLVVERTSGFKNSCLVQENSRLSSSDHHETEWVPEKQSHALTEDEEMAIEALLLLTDHERVENLVPEKKAIMMNSNNGGVVCKRKKVVDDYDDDFIPEKKMKLVNRNSGGTDKKRKKVVDEEDDDFVPEKKSKMTNRNGAGKPKKGKKADDANDDGPDPPPAMPQEFKDRITELVGQNRVISREKLVVQKKLETSDILPGQNRFSIPNGKLREKFLEKHEEGKGIQSVNIIDPSLRHHVIDLPLWTMNKSVNALNGPGWREIRETNRLLRGMIMQLWAVRVDNVLWFALVDITPPALRLLLEKEAKEAIMQEAPQDELPIAQESSQSQQSELEYENSGL